MSELTFEFEPHPEAGYVRIRVRGKLTAPESREARLQVIAAHPTLNRLWDFAHSDLTAWSIDDMRMFIEVITPSDPNSPVVRVAALVSRDVDYEVARMYEALSAGTLPIQGAVFRDEAEAIRWIREGR